MARTKLDKYVSHHIPCIDVLRMSKSNEAEHGKYIIKLDGSWQLSSADIKEGFREYSANSSVSKKNHPLSKSIKLKKNNYSFDGVVDYSLDLRQLIDYCDKNRITKKYFKTTNKKNLCLALVKINFDKNTKEVRKLLYGENGLTITYCVDGDEIEINYVRYKRTASSAREGSCLFIAKDLFAPMIEWSRAGIDLTHAKSVDSISWEAYIALTLSSIESTLSINPRQILFVEDCEVMLEHGDVFEISNKDQKLISTPKTYSDQNDEDHCVSKNKIWDGEGLIDSEFFIDNEVLKEKYQDKCMLLLRGKLFKACVFKTHIQKWFKDNGISDETHKVSDLNGYTQAKKISDIRLIIPYSCLKFLKFRDKSRDKTEAIKNWIKDIAGGNTQPLFGIIKSDKKSKLLEGKKVYTTYQMLNTLGFNEETTSKFLQPTIEMMENIAKEGKEGAESVKYYLDNLFFNRNLENNESDEATPEKAESFEVFNYEELVASKLLSQDLTDNEEIHYYDTPHYQSVRRSLLDYIKRQALNGRVLIDGVYATLFCNGIELLKHAIDKNYTPNTSNAITLNVNGVTTALPVLKQNEIYTKMFEADTELLCARNPHITMGNYYLATNKECYLTGDSETIYDKYFVLSNEIVCVNAIDSDIMNILNGCDFDSDTALITNNSVMVDLLKKQFSSHESENKFRPPFNNVASKTLTLDKKNPESDFLAENDDKLSNNSIGSIINLSQRLNSLIWMLAPLEAQGQKYANFKLWTAEIGKEVYEKGCCTLAVLSNIEIDSAKRSYACNTRAEMTRIKGILGDDYQTLKEYTSWLDDKSDYSPLETSGNKKILSHNIVGLDPMGYIIKVITSNEERIKSSLPKATATDYDFVSELLGKNKIPESDKDCSKELDTCIKILVECFQFLEQRNLKEKDNQYYKRSYSEDCTQIIQCCSSINATLSKNTEVSNSLFWKLIELLKTNTRLLSTEENKKYIITKDGSEEYKKASKEMRIKTPRALLWAALFWNYPTSS